MAWTSESGPDPKHGVSAPSVVRVATAMLGAAILLSAALTLIELALATAGGEAVLQQTGSAVLVFASTLILYAMTFGLAGVGLLRLAGLTGHLAWALTGAVLGFAAAMLHGVLMVGTVHDWDIAVAGVLSVLLFLLVRGFPGMEDG